jgi:hypothetical protein
MTEIIVKVYYRDGSDEVRNFKDLAEAVSCLRGEKIQIGYVLMVDADPACRLDGEWQYPRATTVNVADDFDALWMERERDDLTGYWWYGAKNTYGGTLEAFLDRAEGPEFFMPSVRRPETVSRGFTPQSIAAE